jgi:hypothetical protein
MACVDTPTHLAVLREMEKRRRVPAPITPRASA